MPERFKKLETLRKRKRAFSTKTERKPLEDKYGKLVGDISKRFYTLIATSENFPLKDSFLLDSASSIHVSRNRDRFINFRKAPPGHYAICGSGSVPILGYGEIDIELTDLKGRKRILRLHDVAFCPMFPTKPR